MFGRQQAQDAAGGGVAALVSTKVRFAEPDRPRRIQAITFDVQSPVEIAACGVLNVHEHSLFKMPERRPATHGVLDPRMGVSNRMAVCDTCGGKLADCIGHFGTIQLQLPVFHIGYFKHVIGILQCICKSCARVLLPDEELRKMSLRLRRARDHLHRAALYKKVNEKTKRVKSCPWCGEMNGIVKKCPGALKILHEKYGKGDSDALAERRTAFAEASRINDEITPLLKNMTELLDPLKVLELFRRVSDSDLTALDIKGRPENLLMTQLAVPPVCIRPSVEMDGGGGSNEDDVTVKMMHIVQINRYIQSGLGGLQAKNVAEWWDSLQVECAMFINSDLPGMPSAMHTQGKRLRGFVQRLKGKQGRFRGNLSGKRVDFTGRTVISPDPNVRIDEVVVPRHMAVVLTYPERVTAHNIDKLRRAVINGTREHPGARFVISQDGHKSFLQYGDRRRIASELKIGDVVERHLNDGDIILFNRQPSLHRVSIMAFRARVMPWRTLRFNECCCSPFNADFDGDEMNIHVPQTEEARAEAWALMGVLHNLQVPKSGETLVAATQDFLTCAYLLTRRDAFFTRSEFAQLCSYMGDGMDRIHLPAPTIVKPVELWTGKQLFSVLIRPNLDVNIFITMETKEKTGCSCKDVKGPHSCPGDGYVFFLNSELIMGRLGKSTLGGGNKTGMFAVLVNDYSPQAAAACMSRLAKLSARFMGDRGFSIGIDDVTPSDSLTCTKNTTVEENYAKCDGLILKFNQGKLELNPGCSPEETLENEIKAVLNNVRNIAAGVCMSTLTPWNSPLIQSQCGSKGSPINICQMVACVGQQIISGKRSPNGFTDRTLPHFPRGDKTPEGKGFVANSFFTGLTPTEFFFHTMAGREGLVDTAVKTAETGYMSRRLMKALEDLFVHYDGTVRAANRSIVQFSYGDDGLEPMSMESTDGQPLDLIRTMSRVRALTPHRSGQPILLPGEAREAVRSHMAAMGLEKEGAGGYSEKFVETVKAAVEDQVVGVERARERLGLEAAERGAEELEAAVGRVAGLTEEQVKTFIMLCCRKFASKRADPGATVGAYGAQSIGEPGTQMTLKTFHFAGVAAMNVTLGVPRIKEIINAAKTISTPIINVELSNPHSELAARVAKARLEATQLGGICRYIRVVIAPRGCYIAVCLDRSRLRMLQLDITAKQVAYAVQASKLKVKEHMIQVQSEDKLRIFPDDLAKEKEYEGKLVQAHMDDICRQLPSVIVSGIPTITRAIISKDDKKFVVFAEGTDMQAVMGTPGVLATKVTTNHILEVHATLGIEAARSTIIKEIQYTMGQHGMVIDYRHVMLLADCMTSRGDVLGITRFGIAKMKDSVLMLASFEKTTDHLFDAAARRRTDTVDGVSESIIMGVPMPSGTGLFRVMHNDADVADTPDKTPPAALIAPGRVQRPVLGATDGTRCGAVGEGLGTRAGLETGWPVRDVPLFAC